MEEITLTYYVKTQQFKMKHLLCVSTRNKCLHCTMPSPRTEDLVRTPKSNWVLWHIGLLVIPASATWKVGLSGGQGCLAAFTRTASSRPFLKNNGPGYGFRWLNACLASILNTAKLWNGGSGLQFLHL